MSAPFAPSAVTLIEADYVALGDAAGTMLRDAAVAVAGERIVAVGAVADLVGQFPDAVRDGVSRSLLTPGFINTHCHAPMAAMRGVADDRNLEDFLDTVMPLESALLGASFIENATELGLIESVLSGVTSVLDMYFFPSSEFAAGARVGTRLYTGPLLLDPLPGPLTDGVAAADRAAFARGWLADPPPLGGGRAVVLAHSAYLSSEAMLRDAGVLAEEFGAVLHLHASETVAEVERVRSLTGASPIEYLDRLGLLGPRTVLAHVVHVTPAEIETIARGGASVSHCPTSNLSLASGLAPVSEFRAAGVPVTIGTDGPSSSNHLDVRAAARLAALVAKTRDGDATALPAATLLHLCTEAAARSLGEDDLGCLQSGYRADVVRWDLSGAHHQPVLEPLSNLFATAQGGDVRDVWVGGRPIVADHRLLTRPPDRHLELGDALGELVQAARAF